MAYVKPGVTVDQVQTNVSPNLAPPSLNACIIGAGYDVQETTDEVAVYTSSGFSTTQTYSNLADTTAYLKVKDGGTIDSSSVYVDLLSPSTAGWFHVPTADITVDTGLNTVVINSGLSADLGTAAHIRVGYRALLSGLNQYFTVESQSDVVDKVGKAVTYNPLAFGLSQALINAGSTVSAYGVLADTTGEHTTALDALALQEVYALAPMTHQTVESSYGAHVDSMSVAALKKERIAVVNAKWAWFESDGTTSADGPLDVDVDKSGTATGLAARAFGVGKKRVFYTNPDTFYVNETRPLATVKQSYLANSNNLVTTYGLYAQFTETWVYNNGVTAKTYYAGDNIDDTAHTRLMENTAYGYPSQSITVAVPAPGYYLAAGLAGQISGQRPEQGHTNMQLSGGFNKLKYSGDYFSETQLNTLAGGGNWIFWQANSASPIVTRHQLSTDISSVEKQELSITKSVDFTSKFIRNGLVPYIGKYNITPSFLKLVKSILQGMGTFLRREGYINDLKVLKVEQDSVSKDTILVTLDLAVKYPVNYIKITLQF